MFRKTNRAAAVATAAAIALGSVGLSPTVSTASPLKQPQFASQSDITEFSGRRRHYGNGNAAAAAAVIGLFGTIAAIAIAEQERKRWRRHHGYYGAYPGPHYGRPYGHPYGAYRPY
jgi:hypothetical protein